VKRFGANLLREGGAVDNEGNEVSVLFLDEACNIIATNRAQYDEQGDVEWSADIICGTCGEVIEEEEVKST